jgi:uncharacterized protein YbjT (DUF2867 family)
MDVVVAGGHGKIGLRLLRLLAQAGHDGRGLIRNPAQAADLEEAGATPVVCDMEAEDDLSSYVEGADAIVFAAGAGPGSGAERKKTVDLGAAVKLIDAAKATGLSRYVMVSAIGAPRMADEPGDMQLYYQAKAQADTALEGSGLDHTIVRPGGLTDDPGTSHVTVAPELDRGGQIPRDDVAAVLLAVLDAPNSVGKAFDLVEGSTPIGDAVRAL